VKNALPEITLSVSDFARLQNVAAGAMSSAPDIASFLQRELDRANVVPRDRTPSAVKMGSLVRFRDDFSGRIRQVRVAYPADADPAAGHISVLTPVGAALIGLSAGQTMGWRDRQGRAKTLTVLEVQHEIEAAGYLNT
jgi:regulator of nucleoside diphosphate kinase